MAETTYDRWINGLRGMHDPEFRHWVAYWKGLDVAFRGMVMDELGGVPVQPGCGEDDDERV